MAKKAFSRHFFSLPCDRFFLWALLPALAFFFIVILSRHFDWDHFLAMHEVELRSWLLDGRPPLWSYQLCAGVARLGDPQSFGLSLLFLPTIILGSYFGPKFTIVFSAILGTCFTYLTLNLLEHWKEANFVSKLAVRQTTLAQRGKWAIAVFFVCSQFFAWHFYIGHVTFLMFYWAIGLAFFTLKGLRFGLKRREFLLSVLVVQIFFSSGFYHASVYFLLPLIPLFFWSLKDTTKRNLGQVALASLLGLMLSSYKWWWVLDYQRRFPRLLEQVPEYNTLSATAAFHLLPTFNFDFFWPFEVRHFWFIWENTFFSAYLWPMLVALIWMNKRIKKMHLPLWPGLMMVILTGLVFSMGQFVSWAPFPWINQYLLGGSVRTLSRFNVSVSWALAIGAYFVFQTLPTSRAKKIFLLSGWFLCLISLSGHLKMLSFSDLSYARKLGLYPARKMRTFTVTKEWAAEQSYMYGPILSGLGVINCYNPLSRKEIMNDFLKEQGGAKDGLQKIFYLLHSPLGQLNRNCIRGSYVRQNELVIDPQCPKKICVNLNAINIYQETDFSYNETHKKFCNF